MEELLQMNSKERNRLKAIIRIETGSLNQKTASEQLCISIRQLQRLIQQYRKKGEQALVSKRRGKRSNHSLSDDSRKKIAEIITKNYEDFGPSLAHEYLVENYGIKASISSVRNIMIEEKIWISKKVKAAKVHQRRAPRDCYGELLQMDGSYHDWFEGRAPE